MTEVVDLVGVRHSDFNSAFGIHVPSTVFHLDLMFILFGDVSVKVVENLSPAMGDLHVIDKGEGIQFRFNKLLNTFI